MSEEAKIKAEFVKSHEMRIDVGEFYKKQWDDLYKHWNEQGNEIRNLREQLSNERREKEAVFNELDRLYEHLMRFQYNPRFEELTKEEILIELSIITMNIRRSSH